MRLDPQARRELEAVLKKSIPSPADPAFDELLLELRRTQPALAEKLESAILFDEMPTPEEESAKAVGRREWWSGLKRRLLDRYDELSGEWVPSRPKQILVSFTVIALGAAGWLMLSTMMTPATVTLPTGTGNQTSPATQQGAGQQLPNRNEINIANSEQNITAGNQANQPGTPTGTAVTQPDPQAQAQNMAMPPPPMFTSTPPPPPPPGAPGEATAQPQLPPMTLFTHTPPGALQAQSPQAPAQAEAPQPLTLATASPPRTDSPRLTLSAAPTPTAPGPGQGQGATRTLAEDVGALVTGQPLGGSPAQRDTARAGLTLQTAPQATFTVRQAEGQDGQEQSFFLMGGTQGQAQTTGAAPAPATAQGVSPQPVFPPFPPAQTPVFPPAPPAQLPIAPQVVTTPPAAPYALGTRLRGRLGVTVLIAEGTPGPVVVDAEDGSTWIGQVSLDETRRLTGRLTHVIRGGREYSVTATLLDNNGTLGVTAQIREEAPSIAADLIRGSLRGVSDYVTAASQARQVTILPGGAVAQAAQTPPLGLFMAGSLADLFALRQGNKAMVRVAQAERGTEVVIFVIPSETPTPARPRP